MMEMPMMEMLMPMMRPMMMQRQSGNCRGCCQVPLNLALLFRNHCAILGIPGEGNWRKGTFGGSVFKCSNVIATDSTTAVITTAQHRLPHCCRINFDCYV